MSKHISRLLSSSKFYARPTTSSSLQLQQFRQPIRFQGTGGKGKGPITWKTLSFIAVGGAGLLGFFYYVKNEKEAGKFLVRGVYNKVAN